MRYMVFLQKIRLKLRGVKQVPKATQPGRGGVGRGRALHYLAQKTVFFSHSSSGRLGTAP